ncbi:MAG: EamA family transporter [Sphingobacteriales bacterium]|nr:MAG: EamA family transporter [Sphingobacteriales bacterium]
MSTHSKAWIALVFICIAWGTTYLGIKLGLQALPPFLMAGSRQFLAGMIIFLMALGNKLPKDLSRNNIARQALIGFLLITMGNGLVSWAEAYIPSGVAALLCATMPIMSVLLNLTMQRTERISPLIVTGMIVGFFGVALNFRDSVKDLSNSDYLLGIVATLIATTTWAYGSIISKKNSIHTNPIFNSALQVSFGGLFLLLFSPAVDNYDHINLHNTEGLLAIVYLIIVGSVLAYTAYMYVLKHLPVGLVMVYAYINPLVAVLLGWWLVNEPLTIYTMLSFICIACGLFLVNKGYKKAK